jgi:DNA repair exonuclease SbcCD ATPase subunit
LELLTTRAAELAAAQQAVESNRQQAVREVEQERSLARQEREAVQAQLQLLAKGAADLASARLTLDDDRQQAVLETELEAVRNRAAEMTETLAQRDRQLTEERAQWAEELKRMRRLLETVAERQERQPAEAPPPASNGSRTRDEKPAGDHNSDPVLESVMAQFEMLQKDLQRRKKATVAGAAQ